MPRLRLEEFPLSLLERSCAASLQTRRFTAVVGERRVALHTEAEPGQLPASGDMAVLLGLFTMYRGGAAETRTLDFALYQLTLVMRQKASGRLSERIKNALQAWNRAVYTFESQELSHGAGKPHTSVFQILETCSQLSDRRWRIQWSDPVWYALIQGAWSGFKADILFDLAPLPRQLYCFLVSRFRTSAAPVHVELLELAFEHLGISRTVPVYRVLTNIRKACAVLEQVYLKPTTERLQKRDGKWHVVFDNPTVARE
jgi:hypothetical protein